MSIPAIQSEHLMPARGRMNAPGAPGMPGIASSPSGAQGKGFTSLLTASSSDAQGAGKTREERAREAVEQLVSSAFILPLMQEVRDQPLDSDLFDGGYAEDSFRQQLDTVLADRMVAGGNFPVVEVIYDRIMQTYQQRDEGLSAHRALDVAA